MKTPVRQKCTETTPNDANWRQSRRIAKTPVARKHSVTGATGILAETATICASIDLASSYYSYVLPWTECYSY